MTEVLTPTERRIRDPRRYVDVVTARPALALLPLRIFLGITFSFAGLQKLADPSFFDASKPTSIQGQLALVRSASPLRFMLGIVADHGVLFGVAIAVIELLVGLATLFGLWQRLAAVVGGLVALSFFLTISWRTTPYYYGSDIVFLFAWTPLMILGAPLLSLDAWRTGRPQLGDLPIPASRPAARPPAPTARTSGALDDVEATRRAVLATGGVGAAFVLTAGLDAGLGWAPRHRSGNGPSAAPPPTHPAPSSHGSPSGSHQPPASSPPATNGTAIASAADVPVGGAKTFTDPKSGAPAYVVQPAKGDFRAFSAICTHAGCTVAFVQGSEQFQCPCHGGVYDAKTGQVLGGPPPAPLDRIKVTEANGQLVVPEGA